MAKKFEYVGIGYCKRRGSYYSSIRIDGVSTICGYADSPIKCAKLRDLYIIRHKIDVNKYPLQIIKPIKISTT